MLVVVCAQSGQANPPYEISLRTGAGACFNLLWTRGASFDIGALALQDA